MSKNAEKVFTYHEQTKHLPHRYAPSPMGLDWATEPLPYRLYEGAERVQLPLLQADPQGGYKELFIRETHTVAFSTENIAAFFELSMGLSAVKTFMDNTWALRMNPSSGNLHPTESYIITMGKTPSEGVFHYTPYFHGLEKRAALSENLAEELRKSFRHDGFIIILTSIDWREAWKYGARAFRYSCLDTGHAAAAMSFSAALLGWQVTHLQRLPHKTLRAMLGFNGDMWAEYEEERVEAAFYVHRAAKSMENIVINEETKKLFNTLKLRGSPNRLSVDHVHWPLIEEVTPVTEKESTEPGPVNRAAPREHLYTETTAAVRGADVIRGRRSAQAYNGEAWINKSDFFAIIDKTIPRPLSAPFDVLAGGARLNIVLFIHRVEGLKRGLYILLRDKNERLELEKHMKSTFTWSETEFSDLYLLMEGDLTEEARYIFCQQDIAGDALFAAAMIARFKENIQERPSIYNELFMEAGIIGQALYIAAEAHGMAGTGIGCFYDDLLHKLLGLTEANNTYQSLYHFTVGSPLLDKRITTTEPYAHLR